MKADIASESPNRSPRRAGILAMWEALLVVVGLVVYFGVRVLVQGDGARPFDNAASIVRFEKALHLDWEIPLQQAVIDHVSLVRLFNWVYIWGHWPVLIATMFFLFLRHRDIYRRLRMSMIISGTVGLLIFLTFPVAPPRLADVGVSDTIAIYDSAYQEVGGRSQFTNQYAAMPSFHFGWNLLAGLCLASAVRRRLLRVLFVALPILMALAITATGNHYVVDAVAGGAIALLGLTVAVATEPAGHPVVLMRPEPVSPRRSGAGQVS